MQVRLLPRVPELILTCIFVIERIVREKLVIAKPVCNLLGSFFVVTTGVDEVRDTAMFGVSIDEAHV